jgi:hypothetical protein
MATIESPAPDTSACPFLGLDNDRRTRYTYPHPGHRCFVTGRAKTTDARRQSTYCLDPGFAACDRYQARERKARTAAGQGSRFAVDDERLETPIPVSGAPATVVYVSRAGDSLERMATTYDLTAEQIAQVNGLDVNALLAEGTRLVIPLAARGRSGKTEASTREDGLD